MPIIRVSMFEGRSIEKKRELVEAITEVVARVCEDTPDGVSILIEELPRESWARGGVLYSDRRASNA